MGHSIYEDKHNKYNNTRLYESVVQIGLPSYRVKHKNDTSLPKYYDDKAFMRADTTGNIPKSTAYIHAIKILWYNDHMTNKVCEKCGESARCCLVYHHINPNTKVSKDRSISIMIRCKDVTIPEIIEEINTQCILLCKNCHSKIHSGIL